VGVIYSLSKQYQMGAAQTKPQTYVRYERDASKLIRVIETICRENQPAILREFIANLDCDMANNEDIIQSLIVNSCKSRELAKTLLTSPITYVFEFLNHILSCDEKMFLDMYTLYEENPILKLSDKSRLTLLASTTHEDTFDEMLPIVIKYMNSPQTLIEFFCEINDTSRCLKIINRYGSDVLIDVYICTANPCTSVLRHGNVEVWNAIIAKKIVKSFSYDKTQQETLKRRPQVRRMLGANWSEFENVVYIYY